MVSLKIKQKKREKEVHGKINHKRQFLKKLKMDLGKFKDGDI